MKNKVLYAITIVVAILFILIGYFVTKSDKEEYVNHFFKSGQVLSVGEIYESENSQIGVLYLPFTVKIDGEEIAAIQTIDNSVKYIKKDVEVGDNVLITKFSDSETWYFTDYNRIPSLIFLALIFLGLILLIGKMKGFKTILSLIFTVAAILLIYIPGILKGFNIYILTTVVISFIIVISLLLINDFNKKTFCAILGNIGGVIVTGILAIIFNKALNITGIVDSDYVYITLLDSNKQLDLVALVWGGILIGSVGAIMDVSMTIASSMNELDEHMKDKSFKKMVTSGLNIGKDAIGTMTNTLILAYIGGSLASVLILNSYIDNPLQLFNLEMIVVEISQSLIGSIGILFAVPVTTVLAAYIFNKTKKDSC